MVPRLPSLLCLLLSAAPALAQGAPEPEAGKPPERYRRVPDAPLPQYQVAGEGETRAQPQGTETFGPEVYAKRRAQVRAALKTGVAVVHAAPPGDDESRQDSDFYWLTGLDERGAALVLSPQDPDLPEVLYLAPRDVEGERWTGERAALSQDLKVRTGFREVRRTTWLPGALTRLAHRFRTLRFLGPLVAPPAPESTTLELVQKVAGRVPGASVSDDSDLLPRLREVKEPREVEKIRKATEVTAAGFQAMFKAARAGVPEYVVKDAFHDAVRNLGARHLSYGSITGSGPDGTVLHYPRDDRKLQAGELMVADCAAEWERYASDVTRTFPVGGRFGDEQRAIYELVLRAQEAAIARLKPGVRWREVEDTARQVIAEAGYGDYFIHGVGHFVGLDVHDPGLYDQPLPAGAVVTVEPGIYLPGKGIGVRIEDVVLVTPTGHEVLSRSIPKQVAELEALTRP